MVIPFIEIAAQAAAAGEAAAAGAAELNAAGELAAEGMEAAGAAEGLPAGLSSGKPEISGLPDDLGLPEPAAGGLPDDLSLPEPETGGPLDGLGQPEPESKVPPDTSGTDGEDRGRVPSDVGEKVDAPPESGSEETEKEKGEGKEKDKPERKMEPPVKIIFKCPEGCDAGEFNRQVKNQEKGLNDMTLDEFFKNREKYKENKEKNENGSGRDAKEGNSAQQRARDEARADKVKEYRDKGMSREEAEAKADEWMKDQAALHNPDQVAGGDPKKVDGVGDSKVNSSIGGQWGGGRANSMEQQVRDYIEKNGIPAEDLGRIKLNVQLDVE